ncbi:AMP-binding protein [Devosia sp. YIM 151766]|uniref:class I adenylate-forming enzyme family protein n=1 Tax=Devosia sp. YIM 151766 TaxID=3017325 RepID=UPI00255C32FF|nr:AMP-binding protein [Devosia sp. YIM 151766]WIY53168.1 AMP-binding protein [Devosia sp. YIM 151766]
MTISPDVSRPYADHCHTLGGLFDSRAQADPDRPFLSFDDRRYTWRQFAAEIERVAAVLHGRNVRKGDRVAICSTNSDAHVILLLALARIGAAMVPLNPAFGVEEMRYILADADVSGVIGSLAVLPIVRRALQLAGMDRWLMQIDGEADDAPGFFSASAARPAPASGAAGDTCVIIYTSGTTGMPKGVMHSQKNFVLCAEVVAARVGLRPDDKVLIILPFFHVNALFYSLASMLAAGASGTVLPRFSAGTFWDSVVQSEATQVNLIEAVGNILQKRPRTEFRPEHRLRVVYGVRQAFVETFHKTFGIPLLVAGYGLTECPGALCNPLGGPEKPGSIGVTGRHPDPAQSWTQARVVDEAGNEVADGEAGELLLKSPALMQGYFRDPEQTAAAFRDGWFATGDLVRRDRDGYYFFLSRKKDIIRRRGENISGAELDRVIGEHPAVHEAAAIAVPAELGEDDILVAIVLRPGLTLRAEDVAAWCVERLAAMKVPRFVTFVEKLPHTPTHKIAKAVLRADSSLLEQATDLERKRM